MIFGLVNTKEAPAQVDTEVKQPTPREVREGLRKDMDETLASLKQRAEEASSRLDELKDSLNHYRGLLSTQQAEVEELQGQVRDLLAQGKRQAAEGKQQILRSLRAKVKDTSEMISNIESDFLPTAVKAVDAAELVKTEAFGACMAKHKGLYGQAADHFLGWTMDVLESFQTDKEELIREHSVRWGFGTGRDHDLGLPHFFENSNRLGVWVKQVLNW